MILMIVCIAWTKTTTVVMTLLVIVFVLVMVLVLEMVMVIDFFREGAGVDRSGRRGEGPPLT